eukprot:06698_6
MLAVRAPVVRQHRLLENPVGYGADEGARIGVGMSACHRTPLSSDSLMSKIRPT